MRHERGDHALLWDMLDAARAVRAFVAGRTFEDYRADRMFRNAVERNVEIIGEAAGRVSREFRDEHPEIPWRQIVAQRNCLVHGYAELDPGLVWNVATRHLEDLAGKLEKVVPEAPVDRADE
jgi:uncharacterized protein with HEPN domain